MEPLNGVNKEGKKAVKHKGCSVVLSSQLQGSNKRLFLGCINHCEIMCIEKDIHTTWEEPFSRALYYCQKSKGTASCTKSYRNKEEY